MHLLSVNAGRPRIVVKNGRQYSTSINKSRVRGRVAVTETGVAGDRQADASVHGGADLAVCVYPHEHYRYFANRLGLPELAVPSFGENFTTTGLVETDVRIGDVFTVGGARVQVTQPREPCFKLAGKHGRKEMIAWILETGFCGFYLRVLGEGEVGAGDELNRVEHHADSPTIADALRIMAVPGATVTDAAVRALIAAPGLSPRWHDRLLKRLGDEA